MKWCYQRFTQVQKKKKKKKIEDIDRFGRGFGKYVILFFFFVEELLSCIFFLSVSLHFSTPHTRAYDTCTDLHGPARCSLLQCGGRLTGLLLGLYRDTQIFRLINLLSSNAARFRSSISTKRRRTNHRFSLSTIIFIQIPLSLKLALVYTKLIASLHYFEQFGEENILTPFAFRSR